MENPKLIAAYAHLLCTEALSDEIEDVSQHLFLRACQAGLLRPLEEFGQEELGSESLMIRVLKIGAYAAEPELRCLANKLENLLLQEFEAQLALRRGKWQGVA